MEYIRQATIKDVSRIAEILVFTKRMNYRRIFHNDKVSFGEIQVYPLVQDMLNNPEKLKNIWVYDDEFVKGMIHVDGERIQELYVDFFFEGDDLVYLCRTALNGAHNYHDANYSTFHRLSHFRDLL